MTARRSVVTGLLLGAAACGSGAVDGPAPDVAHYEPAGSGSDAALLTGRLVRDGGCTYVVDDAAVRWVAAFPDEGITWSEDGLLVGGRRYEAEARVELAGGEGSRAGVVLPEGCDATAPVWRVGTG